MHISSSDALLSFSPTPIWWYEIFYETFISFGTETCHLAVSTPPPTRGQSSRSMEGEYYFEDGKYIPRKGTGQGFLNNLEQPMNLLMETFNRSHYPSGLHSVTTPGPKCLLRGTFCNFWFKCSVDHKYQVLGRVWNIL